MTPVVRPITSIILHHSEGPEGASVAELRAKHVQQLGFDDIGWHWIVTRAGGWWHLEPGRDEGRVGAHDKGENEGSIGVVLCGDYVRQVPDPVAWCMLVAAVADLCRRHGLGPDQVEGHGEDEPPGEPGTLCPGIDMPQLRCDVAGVLNAVKGGA